MNESTTPVSISVVEVEKIEPISSAETQPKLIEVEELLKKSWEGLKRTWPTLLLFYGVSFGLSMLTGVIGIIVFLVAGGWEVFANLRTIESYATTHIGQLIGSTSIAVLTMILLLVVTAIWTTTASLLYLASYYRGKDITSGTAFSQASRLFGGLFTLSIVVSLLSWGGTMLFIVPGVIISVLLAFSLFEMMFHQTSTVESLANSVNMVRQNFGGLFVRVLVVVGIQMAYQVGLQFLQMIPIVGLLASIISIPLSIGLTFFFYHYYYLLYQSARQHTNLRRSVNLGWMWGVAIVGWILFLMLGYVGYRAIGSFSNYQKERALNMIEQDLPAEYRNQSAVDTFDESTLPTTLKKTKDSFEYEFK